MIPTPQSGGDQFGGNLQHIDPNSPVGRLVHGPPRNLYAPLTEQQRLDAEEIAKDQTCRYCGGVHARACPRVKRLVFSPDGKSVVEVEYWPWDQWPEGQVVFPEDLVEEGEDDEQGSGGA